MFCHVGEISQSSWWSQNNDIDDSLGIFQISAGNRAINSNNRLMGEGQVRLGVSRELGGAGGPDVDFVFGDNRILPVWFGRRSRGRRRGEREGFLPVWFGVGGGRGGGVEGAASSTRGTLMEVLWGTKLVIFVLLLLLGFSGRRRHGKKKEKK